MVKLTGVKFLTKQEQIFLAVVLGLLLTGLFVKWYRTAHPAGATATGINSITGWKLGHPMPSPMAFNPFNLNAGS